VTVIESEWLITSAVVQGKSHLDSGVPCQDACHAATTADGRWLVAAVSDGAGSAPRSREASAFVARHVASALIAETAKIEARGPGVWLKDRVHAIVIEAREQLREMGPDIAEFHCTLLGVLLGPTGGFFFHVGDGAALASSAGLQETSGKAALKLWRKVILSEPENGEYVNETYFITQDDWDKHLRSLVLPDDIDIIALMTDGAMPFVIQKGRPYAPFIDPVIAKLLDTPDPQERQATLESYLASPATYGITGDDKTLFIAIRGRLRGRTPVILAPSVQEETGSAKAQAEHPRAEIRQDGPCRDQRRERPPRSARAVAVSPPAAGSAYGRLSRRLTRPPAMPPTAIATLLASLALVLAVTSLTLSLLLYFNVKLPWPAAAMRNSAQFPAPSKSDGGKAPSAMPTGEGPREPSAGKRRPDDADATNPNKLLPEHEEGGSPRRPEPAK
jgi:hypothetical protein